MTPRRLQPELMDDPSLPAADHHAALHNLAKLNRVSRAAHILWPHIRAVADQITRDHHRPTTILDIATGSADVPIALAKLNRGRPALDLRACDISPIALAAARERAAREGVTLTLDQHDVLAGALPYDDATIDIVTCSLFLHHLTEDDAVRVLAEMKRVARVLVLASDLRRCTPGLIAAYFASRTLTRSHVVHIDAVRSVQGAFTMTEFAKMATCAGMRDFIITRRWPFRMLLSWPRPLASTPHPTN